MSKTVQKFIKRTFDIVAALGGIVVFSPVLLVSGVLIKTKLGSPIFFRQKRIGKDNKEFEMIKFRTMKDVKDKFGNDLPDSERLTKLGKLLRSLSIDELPELINILKGDMSLIGPRPLLIEYLPLYNARQIKRHNVLPGLTGLAQVSGRNAISWEDKFELDVKYVEEWSLKMDAKIFFLTFYKIFKRDGISQEGEATMEKFKGEVKDIVVIGAGGVGKETISIIEDINKEKLTWNIKGIIDDNKNLWNKKINGYEVLGDLDYLKTLKKGTNIVVAIANYKVKKYVAKKLKDRFNFATIIHPKVEIHKSNQIGEGSIIYKGVVMTTNINIGNHVIISPKCGIGHDSIIKDYSSLLWNVNISGCDIVEEGVLIGSGATVIQNKTIGKGSIIGAGSVVIKDIEEFVTAVGVPAKVIKNNLQRKNNKVKQLSGLIREKDYKDIATTVFN